MRAQSERGQQIEQVRPAGVLHGHAIAGTQVRAEHPLDAVQRTAGDGEGSLVEVDAVGRERRPGDVDQLGQRPTGRISAGVGRRDGRERRGEWRTQARIGFAGDKI